MKFLRQTAFILAAAVTLTTLTSCQGDYSNSSVKHVTNKAYASDYMNGKYTGDWKGDRPDGYGELIISDDEYYKGEWVHGVLYGQGEIRKVSDDGVWKYYKGECASNYPSGEGQMLMGIEGDPYLIEVDGDFGDESSLMYFVTDEKGKLIETGGICNGGFVNYVDNDSADIPWVHYSEEEKIFMDNLDVYAAEHAEEFASSYSGTKFYEEKYTAKYNEIYNDLYENHVNIHKGEEDYGRYFGQTDENGLPNGYGYYETYTIYNDVASGFLAFRSVLGKWKDGHIDGYYTEVQNINTTSYREDGCMSEGKGVGDFVSSHDVTASDGVNRITVVTMNLDEVNSYQLCDDGAYRTGYRRTDYYFDDGSYGFQEVRYRKDSNASGYMTYLGEPCVREGSYCNYDKDGNVIDYGIPENNGTTEGWQSLAPNYKDLWDTVLIIGGIMLGGYAAYKVYSWASAPIFSEDAGAARMIENAREYRIRSTEDYFESNAKRDELLDQARSKREQAERESGYRRNDLLNDAEKLEREAESHYRSIFS
ncbi:MAG: hypothetical protein HDT24_06835 [Ruminococcus sp.]|nr:hypothetical protein [Ruminococcus sp.]